MSDLPPLNARDRADTKQAAQRVLDAATTGNANPASVLIGQASMMGVPIEQLVTWLARLALESP